MKKNNRSDNRPNVTKTSDTLIIQKRCPHLPIQWVRYSANGEAIATVPLIRLLNDHLKSN
jgi:hypothetical protein